MLTDKMMTQCSDDRDGQLITVKSIPELIQSCFYSKTEHSRQHHHLLYSTYFVCLMVSSSMIKENV